MRQPLIKLQPPGIPDGAKPLHYLLDKVRKSISTGNKTDKSMELLDKLVNDPEGSPSWDGIAALWPLTISFSPAVETGTTNESDDEPVEDSKSEEQGK